jgi:hypothetical protein
VRCVAGRDLYCAWRPSSRTSPTRCGSTLSRGCRHRHRMLVADDRGSRSPGSGRHRLPTEDRVPVEGDPATVRQWLGTPSAVSGVAQAGVFHISFAAMVHYYDDRVGVDLKWCSLDSPSVKRRRILAAFSRAARMTAPDARRDRPCGSGSCPRDRTTRQESRGGDRSSFDVSAAPTSAASGIALTTPANLYHIAGY